LQDQELAVMLRIIAKDHHPGSNPELEQFLIARNIQRMFHFTSVDNLESIFEHGILGINELVARGLNFTISDYMRDEPIDNGICFSITQPNEYMLLHKIQNGRKLVLLELNNPLEILKNHLFIASPGNFGSLKVKDYFKQWPELFTGGEGLWNLFSNMDLREKYKLTLDQPTDPRSEIILLEPLDSRFVNRLIFPPDLEYAAQERIRALIPKLPKGIEIVSQSQELFKPLNWKDKEVSRAYSERTWNPDWT
jgi:hypothetical protein